jgi:hypothetical protein
VHDGEVPTLENYETYQLLKLRLLEHCKWGADRRKEGRIEKQERERKKRKKCYSIEKY